MEDTNCEGRPIRDAEEALADAAAAITVAANSAARTCEAVTRLFTRIDRWAACGELFASTYWKKIDPLLDQLLKLMP